MTTTIVSRPKVFRPPVAAAKKLSLKSKPFILFAVILLAFIGLALIIRAISGHEKPVAHNDSGPTLKQLEVSIPQNLEAKASENAAKGTITIQDNDSKIVGQIAKIPAESEQSGELPPGPPSQIDQTTGRELLTIINKY